MAKVDQRGFDNQRVEFVPAAQAASFLGVQARTLYAYASRGLVARVREGRSSRYSRADLERLKARHDARAGHGPVAGAALNWGEPVLATRVCEVTAEGPRYRGQLATELVRTGTSFAAVCRLLWGTPAGAVATQRSILARVPAAAHDAVTRLMAVTLTGFMREAAPFGLAPTVEQARAEALVRAFASAAGGKPARKLPEDLAARFLAGHGLSPTLPRRRLVDAALVLCADHELNASTFAARVAASTGADLQACLLAALAAFSGPRHGTASHEVEELLRAIGRGRAEPAVRARTLRGQGIPGFGHRLYPAGDPRAAALLARLPKGARLAPLFALITATRRLRGEHPNIDAALVGVARAVGLPAGAAAALFAVGRTAGWIAHVFEQRLEPGLLRPRARYVGPAATPPAV